MDGLTREKVSETSLKIKRTVTKTEENVFSLTDMVNEKKFLLEQKLNIMRDYQKNIERLDSLLAEIDEHINEAEKMGLKEDPKKDIIENEKNTS